MLWVIAWLVVGMALALAVVAGALVARRAPRPGWLDQGGYLLELISAVLVVGVGAKWMQGRHPDSPETLGGYLIAAVVVMPVALGSIREERGPWSAGVVGVAAIAVAVVAIRIMVTR